MTGEQLKKSILQYAVEGKLVPQDLKDEPASVLIEKIREEKERLIEEKVIKRDKNESFIYRKDGSFYEKIGKKESCIDEELPFDIPDNWEWARLSSLAVIIMGQSPKGSSVGENIVGIEFHQGKKNFGEDYINNSNIYTDEPKKIIDVKSIIMSVRAPVGDVNIVDRKICIGRGLCGIVPIICNLGYLYYYIKMLKKYFELKSTGTTFKAISNDIIMNSLIAIPPLTEQKRILAKIEELMPLAEEYGVTKEKINRLNEELPEKMKKSILQYAIEGKLIPQNLKDEPASVLIEKIKEEKERLIEEKVIKRDKKESFIYRKDGSFYEKIGKKESCIDEELPFDIPDNWEWARLSSISCIKGGKRIPKGYKVSSVPTNHIYLSVKSMKKESIEESKIEYISDEVFEKIKNYTISSDDLYITVAGTIGMVGEIPFKFTNANLTENADKIVLFNIELKQYLKIYLNSNIAQNIIKNNTTKVGQPKLAIKRITEFLIPIPPLAEQKRIVAKIEEILPMIEKLK